MSIGSAGQKDLAAFERECTADLGLGLGLG